MRNSSYSFIPILLKLRCCDHALKICMWFGYNPQINFCHFFRNLNLAIFSGILTMKLNGQWVPCVRNSSYSFMPFHLKLYIAHLNDLPVKFFVCVNEGQDKLPTMYWLPKLHKRPYKARSIANSSSFTTTELTKLLAHLSRRLTGELIVYPCSGVRPSSVRRPSVRRSQFQKSSPLKPLGQSRPNFMWSILRKGERKFI